MSGDTFKLNRFVFFFFILIRIIFFLRTLYTFDAGLDKGFDKKKMEDLSTGGGRWGWKGNGIF